MRKILFLMSFWLVVACGSKEEVTAPVAAPLAAAPTSPPAVEDVAQPGSSSDKAAAQHILIQYGGAVRAPASLTRTKDEARKLAEELAGKARETGVDFSALAREKSEDPNTRESGGLVGSFTRGQMVPEFEQAVFGVEPGQLTEVVETSFGFHVIKRLPVEEVTASHILVQYVGAAKAPATVTRTAEEAHKLADDLRLQVMAPGADFGAVAREHSDCPSKSAGGELGTFGRGMMEKKFDDAVFGLKVGEISQVVETPMGFHIILRSR